MGKRGPASSVMEQLSPARRREVDAALVESPTIREVYERFELAADGISESAFYRYAARVRWMARKRYIGDLVRDVAGGGEPGDEGGLVQAARLFAGQRIVELLDQQCEELDLAQVVKLTHAISDLTRARASDEAERRRTQATDAADAIETTLKRRDLDAATLAEIREKVVGLI